MPQRTWRGWWMLRPRRDAGASTLEFVGLAVLVSLIILALVTVQSDGRIAVAVQNAVCRVTNLGDCSAATGGQSPGDRASGGRESGEGGGGDGTDRDDGCSGVLGCTWAVVEQVGSGVYNVGKAAVDDVVGIVDVVTHPSKIIDALGYIWDHPLDAARQMVWDDETSQMWGDGDYGGAIGRTLWNVGSALIPFSKVTVVNKVAGLGRIGQLADEVATLARRATDAVRRGDLRAARELAEAARKRADEAAEEARRLGCALAAPRRARDRAPVGGAGAGRFATVPAAARVSGVGFPLRAAGDCDDAADAARRADAEADKAEAALGATDDVVDLVTPARRQHILYGDATGGGHLWPGAAGKTPFPRSWSGDRIIHEISDVATDPASTRVRQGGRTVVTGTRDGVDIRVIVDNQTGEIVTGYPTNLPRNP